MRFDKNSLPQTKAGLIEYIENLVHKVTESEQITAEKNREIESLKIEKLILTERLAARNRRLFGRSSEKLSADVYAGWLFNELETLAPKSRAETTDASFSTVRTHSRKKRGRKPISETQPREDIVHDLTEEEKRCPSCGTARPVLGEEITEELEYIPARLFVKRHRYPKYGPCACKECVGPDKTTGISCAPFEKRIIKGGMAGESLLAHLVTAKFCDGLPLYRQESIFYRLGIAYPRATMANQMIEVSRACQDLISLMWDDARSGPVLGMDETRLQVLNEPGRAATSQSFMWVTLGYADENPIVLYHYHPSRSGEVARSLLKDFSGFLQSDGYAAYASVGEMPGIISVACWAHVRRKFWEAKKNAPENEMAGLAEQALAIIRRIFHGDASLREQGLAPTEFVRRRRELSLPVIAGFETWLAQNKRSVPPGFKLAQAMSYAFDLLPRLRTYLDHHLLRPDNNLVENAIRPFVIGRKNWLFANTPRGAHASAALYSLVETAKANGLDPFAYFSFLFRMLPKTPPEKLAQLLPYRLDREKLVTG